MGRILSAVPLRVKFARKLIEIEGDPVGLMGARGGSRRVVDKARAAALRLISPVSSSRSSGAPASAAAADSGPPAARCRPRGRCGTPTGRGRGRTGRRTPDCRATARSPWRGRNRARRRSCDSSIMNRTASRPTSSTTSRKRHELAGALRHLHRLAGAQQPHELHDLDVELGGLASLIARTALTAACMRLT